MAISRGTDKQNMAYLYDENHLSAKKTEICLILTWIYLESKMCSVKRELQNVNYHIISFT